VPRRQVAADAKCNQCHDKLAAHGGARNNVEYCAFCHNPNNPADERISRFESQTVTARSLGLAPMVHLIHMGTELTQQPSYLYGFPAPTKANPTGTPIDFGTARYPGDRRTCEACHAAGTQELPLASTLLPYKEQVLTCTEDPAADSDSYCDMRAVQSERSIAAATAACTGCHDSQSARAHAETNTTSGGLEACATCHGPGSAWDVTVVHRIEP